MLKKEKIVDETSSDTDVNLEKLKLFQLDFACNLNQPLHKTSGAEI